MAAIGETDYRNGARERLQEAFILLKYDRMAGGIYLAGRAVEGMLRAIIWKTDKEYAAGKKSLETGHDIREMLKLVQNFGVVRENRMHESIATDVQKVGRLWWNNMRYLPTRKIQSFWYDVGEIGGKRTLKQAVREYYEACSNIVRRCEVLWQS